MCCGRAGPTVACTFILPPRHPSVRRVALRQVFACVRLGQGSTKRSFPTALPRSRPLVAGADSVVWNPLLCALGAPVEATAAQTIPSRLRTQKHPLGADVF